MWSLNSCSAKTTQENRIEKPEKNTSEMNAEEKILVVYFSHTGENYNVGYIEKGNTAIIAEMIADITGADSFEIKPIKEYPRDSYNECVEIAKQEKQENARPGIKEDIAIEDYDVIFLGYPNWWGESPMCIYTFIEKHDWNGKTVYPFITHEGSGMGGTDRKIADACRGADVKIGKGLAIQGTTAQKESEVAAKSVERWLHSHGFKK